MISDIFDKYSLEAQLRPALLALLPLFLTIAVFGPVVYTFATGLVGLVVACGLTTAFSHLARNRGRLIQKKLLKEWGGLPTALWLRHSDDNLDKHTKHRYFQFLEKNISEWHAPTQQEESADPIEADKRYGSATKWLLEQTRDKKKFDLVFKENVSYGFRRNCLGMKPAAIALTLVAISIGLISLHTKSLSFLLQERIPQIVVIASDFVILIWWAFGMTKTWVRDAADAYARALLATCEGREV